MTRYECNKKILLILQTLLNQGLTVEQAIEKTIPEKIDPFFVESATILEFYLNGIEPAVKITDSILQTIDCLVELYPDQRWGQLCCNYIGLKPQEEALIKLIEERLSIMISHRDLLTDKINLLKKLIYER